MLADSVSLAFILFVQHFCRSQDVPETANTSFTTVPPNLQVERKTSEVILQMIEHFKTPDPIGLPGSTILDPNPIPNMTKILPVGTLYFENMAIHGTNKFRILYADADVDNMEIRVAMAFERLQTKGNYRHCTFFCLNMVEGPFTVDVTDLKIIGQANIGLDREGKLRSQDVEMEIQYDKILINFEDVGTLVQGFMNALSDFLFDTIKPYMLQDSYKNIKAAIDNSLNEFIGDIQFPNSISPIDMVLIDVKNAMQENGLDPYKCNDRNEDFGVFTINLSHTWISGLSTLYKTGNVTIKMANSSIVIEFDVGFKKLEGFTHWSISTLNGWIITTGTSSFSVDYVTTRIVVSQPLDTTKTPMLKRLNLDIGNIQTRWDGTAIMDYVIEFAVNVLPNLFRYQLSDLIESHIQYLIQINLNSIDVEEIIRQELPRIDDMQEKGFKLSMLHKNLTKCYDDDDFFNF